MSLGKISCYRYLMNFIDFYNGFHINYWSLKLIVKAFFNFVTASSKLWTVNHEITTIVKESFHMALHIMSNMKLLYLQNVTNHANAPHVRVITDVIKCDNFGRWKLSCAKHHLVNLANNSDWTLTWTKTGKTILLVISYSDHSDGQSRSQLTWYGFRTLKGTTHFRAVWSLLKVSIISDFIKLKSFHLHVKMNDFVAVQIIHCFANLFHETCTRSLCQHKVFIDHSLEKFTALDSWG